VTEYTERELILPALALLDQHSDGLTTSDLIRELTIILKPDGHDDEILAGRNDTYFSQKVRNLVSHRRLVSIRDRPTTQPNSTTRSRRRAVATSARRESVEKSPSSSFPGRP